MELYTIRRRSNWDAASDLETTAAKSTAEGEKMSDEVRWIRTYVGRGGRRQARHPLHL